MDSLKETQHIEVYIQRAYNIESITPVYGEILVREYKGIKSAKDIIEIVKANNEEYDFDLDILEEALRIRRSNNIKVPISINLMPKSIENKNIAKDIKQLINNYNIDKNEIIIEITEETNFSNLNVINNIKNIKELGIKIALDDFGVEKSNIICLVNNIFDLLKVDKAFLNNINDKTKCILRTISELCESLKIECCIEGIETEEHLKLIKQLGYKVVQGYYFEKPFPMKELIGE